MYMPTKCPRCQSANPMGVYAAVSGLNCTCQHCGTVYEPITDCEIQAADTIKPRVLAGQGMTYRKAS
jgi:hypothetical protein